MTLDYLQPKCASYQDVSCDDKENSIISFDDHVPTSDSNSEKSIIDSKSSNVMPTESSLLIGQEIPSENVIKPRRYALPNALTPKQASGSALSPSFIASRAPEQIKSYFREKQEGFNRNFKDIQTYVVDKRERHVSLTRCDNPRLVKLSKPKSEVKSTNDVKITADVTNIKISSRIPRKLPNLKNLPQLTGSRNLFSMDQNFPKSPTKSVSSFMTKTFLSNVKINTLKVTTIKNSQIVETVSIKKAQESTLLSTTKVDETLTAPIKQNKAYHLRRNTSLTKMRSKPKENSYGYVDTTKMTNVEFEEYKKMKKQGKA